MDYAIETRGLSRRFGRTEAVVDLTLEVPAGSVFAFIGPNGAGKTTTIKALMNLLAPSSGSASVLGTDCRRLGPATLARIGYVSENQELPAWMTVAQLVDYCRPFYPTWDATLAGDLARQLDLPLDRPIRACSRGTAMKAALLVSLAYRPELLVMDEPFAGLDALVREEFSTGVLELAGQERPWTVFVSSHDVDEVERSATVIAGGLVLAAAGGGLWQPLDADRDARAVDSSVLAPGSVSVRLSEVRWQSRRPFRNGAIHPERVLTAILTPTGEPDAILLTVDSLDVSLSCGGRTVTGRSYRVPGGSVWSAGRAAQPSDQPYRSIRAALGDTELVLPRAVASQVLVGLGTLPEDEASRLTGLDCVLEGTVGFRAFRYVVTARTALAVDNSLTTTAQQSTITTIGPLVRVLPLVEAAPERPGVDITLRSTVVGPTPWIGRPLPPTGFFLLRNEARRQAVFLTPWGQSRFTPVLGLVSMNVSDVWTGSQRLEFDAVQSEAPFAFDEEWLRGAELLFVEPEFLGVVTRPLRVEGVPAPGGE